MATLILLVYLTLLFLGFNYEFWIFQNLDLTASQFPTLLMSIVLALLYLVPLLYLVYRYVKDKNINIYHFILAFVTGLYLTGFIAAYANDYSDRFLESVLAPSIYEDWSGSLLVPLIEEADKLLEALFVAYLIKAKDLRTYMIVGLGVGLGFQVSEDVAYLTTSASDLNELFPLAYSRLSGSVASHWIYTAILIVGVVLIYRVIRKRLAFQWDYLPWVLVPWLSHFIWNSPLNGSTSDINLVSALVTAITIYTAYDLYRKLDRLPQDSLD